MESRHVWLSGIKIALLAAFVAISAADPTCESVGTTMEEVRWGFGVVYVVCTLRMCALLKCLC